MALCPHNLLLDVLIIVVGEVHETKFQGVGRSCKLIFSIVGIKKSDFDELPYVLSRGMDLRTNNLLSKVLKNIFREVDEAMIQGVKRPCEHQMCFLVIK
jgi:hypothetical protein